MQVHKILNTFVTAYKRIFGTFGVPSELSDIQDIGVLRKCVPEDQNEDSPSKGKMRGFTMMEILISLVILSMLFTMLFLITSRANEMFIDTHNTNEGKNKFYVIYDTVVPMLQSAHRFEEDPNGREWTIYTADGMMHELQFNEAKIFSINGEGFGEFTKVEFERTARNSIYVEFISENMEPIYRTVFCEELIADGY